MTFDLSDAIQRAMYAAIYDASDTAVVRRLLRPGCTFVDAGANVGYYTALAAQAVGPTGRVFAFEPVPEIFRVLHGSISKSNHHHVAALECALGNREGELTLYVPPKSFGNMEPSCVRYAEALVPVRFEVCRLESICAELQIDRIHLLKVDVEAHEPELFGGSANTLRSGSIRGILCEFNDLPLRMRGSSANELMAQLREYEYVPTVEPPGLNRKSVNSLLMKRE